MLHSIKLLVSLVLLLGGGAAIFVGYKKWAWIMRLIFGKERVAAKGINTMSFYLYVIGGVLILLAILMAV